MKKIFIIFLFFPFFIFGQKYGTIKIGDKLVNKNELMKSVDGNLYSLDNLIEKNGLLVIFTCNTCPFVVMWEDRYKLIEDICKSKNIGLVYVNSNYKRRKDVDSFEKMVEHSKKMNYQFQYLLDKKSRLANNFGAKTTPHIFLFNSDEDLVYKGAIDDNYKNKEMVNTFYLKDAIESLVKRKKIKVPSTKPIGCSIKRYEN